MGRVQIAPAAAVLGITLSIGTLAISLRTDPTPSSPPFIVLSVSDDMGDAELLSGLSSMGFDSVIAESTQRVFLDDFGVLKSIPLDAYRDYVEPFDPRDDGYAEALRLLFLSSGRRRAFIPLDPLASIWNPRKMGEKIRSAFADRNAEIFIHVAPRQAAPQAALTAVALTVVLPVFRPFFSLIPILPAVIGLGLLGPAGLVLAGLVLSLYFLLRIPVGEAAYGLVHGLGPNKVASNLWVDFSPRFWVALGLIVLFIVLGIGSSVPFIPAALGLCAVISTAGAIPFVVEGTRLKRGRRRFLPLSLLRPRIDPSGLARVTLPFAVAALCSLALVLFVPAFGDAQGLSTFLGEYIQPLSESDFRAHLGFQRSFSFTSLHSEEAGTYPVYARYQLGPDGLIIGKNQKDLGQAAPDGSPKAENTAEKLKRLLDESAQEGGRTLRLGETASVLVILILCIPALFVPSHKLGRRGSFPLYIDKRAAA